MQSPGCSLMWLSYTAGIVHIADRDSECEPVTGTWGLRSKSGQSGSAAYSADRVQRMEATAAVSSGQFLRYFLLKLRNNNQNPYKKI